MKTVAIALLMVGSCFSATTMDYLVTNKFTTFANLLEQTKLVSTLQVANFTIFEPTNAAFDKVGPALVKTVVADTALLTKVLRYQIVTGHEWSTPAKNELVVKTVAGIGARFNIYVDNKNKQTVTIEGSKISHFDVTADNGIVYVIDSVLMPPGGDIVNVVQGRGQHKMLLSLVLIPGLSTALQTQGLTLFAPTDAAFINWNTNTLHAMSNNVTLLTSILKYHVVNSTQWSASFYNNEALTTLNGKTITIHVTSNGVKVNKNANVVAADIAATNGVVHVIDAVLLPSKNPNPAGAVG